MSFKSFRISIVMSTFLAMLGASAALAQEKPKALDCDLGAAGLSRAFTYESDETGTRTIMGYASNSGAQLYDVRLTRLSGSRFQVIILGVGGNKLVFLEAPAGSTSDSRGDFRVGVNFRINFQADGGEQYFTCRDARRATARWAAEAGDSAREPKAVARLEIQSPAPADPRTEIPATAVN